MSLLSSKRRQIFGSGGKGADEDVAAGASEELAKVLQAHDCIFLWEWQDMMTSGSLRSDDDRCQADGWLQGHDLAELTIADYWRAVLSEVCYSLDTLFTDALDVVQPERALFWGGLRSFLNSPLYSQLTIPGCCPTLPLSSADLRFSDSGSGRGNHSAAAAAAAAAAAMAAEETAAAAAAAEILQKLDY